MFERVGLHFLGAIVAIRLIIVTVAPALILINGIVRGGFWERAVGLVEPEFGFCLTI